MISTGHALGIVAAIALVSAALRFFPALVFRGRETPKSIIYLGDVLPYAIMGMLLVYCLKATPILTASPCSSQRCCRSGARTPCSAWSSAPSSTCC